MDMKTYDKQTRGICPALGCDGRLEYVGEITQSNSEGPTGLSRCWKCPTCGKEGWEHYVLRFTRHTLSN